MFPIDSLFITYCVYVPPLILLYLAEIWTILKPGSPFKGSFYILFVASAVVDLLMICCTVHEFRLVLFPLINGFFNNYDCDGCVRARVTISYICPFAQDMLNCFIALNRLTSIKRPTEHSSIWGKMLPISISISYLLPILIFAASITRKASFLKFTLNGYTLYMASEDRNYLPWYNTHRITTVGMIITNIVIISLYYASSRGLRSLVSSSTIVQQERRLIYFGLMNFFITLPCFLLQLIHEFEFLPVEWLFISFYQFGWTIDAKCFCAAVTMIIVNKTFRRHMLSSFRLSHANVFKTSVSDGRNAPNGDTFFRRMTIPMSP